MEAAQHGFKDMTYGFLGYPLSQAADISIFKAHLVPVGEDQIPHIELARKIVRRFNDIYQPVLVEPEALVGSTPAWWVWMARTRWSKSLNNAVYLSDPPRRCMKRLEMRLPTRPVFAKPIRGTLEVCTVYEYHRVFNAGELAAIESDCRQGKIGCVACKKNLAAVINRLLEPDARDQAALRGPAGRGEGYPHNRDRQSTSSS